MLRRPASVANRLPSCAATVAAPKLQASARHLKQLNPIHLKGTLHYSQEAKMVAGQDMSLKLSELYDGYTNDHGVFKEGPPTTLRLEYIRQPAHYSDKTNQVRTMWSPFEAPGSLATYTPAYFDFQGLASRDYWGHHYGHIPGQKGGHYHRDEAKSQQRRYIVNQKPLRRVPKWLSVIVNDYRSNKMIGFFLYANGAYAAEYLTYKQLPRLTYNRMSNGILPTLGQTVDLSEVTYGKDVHSLEMYPGYGAAVAQENGCSAMILRGTEPNLVPVLMPSREIRLFDTAAAAVFGRRAGVMSNKQRFGPSKPMKWKFRPTRPRTKQTKKSVHETINSGGSQRANITRRIDYRNHPTNSIRQKHWLSAYVVKTAYYHKRKTEADLSSKEWSFGSRPKLYKS